MARGRTKAVGMKNEITDTISRDEFSWATIGWNSECWKRKPPTVWRFSRAYRHTNEEELTEERAAKDQQQVAQLATEKRALDELKFALGVRLEEEHGLIRSTYLAKSNATNNHLDHITERRVEQPSNALAGPERNLLCTQT